MSRGQLVAPPGTRPSGVLTEHEASRQVRDMFSGIAPRYDLLNHLLSLSLDKIWRRCTAQRFVDILRKPDARVLDLCCGTGDLTLALARAAADPGAPAHARGQTAGNSPIILGADFAQPMIERAQRKSRRASVPCAFLGADALALPFADQSFDLVTAAFGFRNLANYAGGLLEIYRVLRPDGTVGILEFSEPQRGPLAALYRFYFKNILPRVGGVISGSSAAYTYLPGSVSKFPQPPELARWMGRAGFQSVQFDLWTFGTVALHVARRPPK